MGRPVPKVGTEINLALARRRSRSRALLAVLLGLAALFYAVSMARIPPGDRPTAEPARQTAS
jgi:hypothetical protein